MTKEKIEENIDKLTTQKNALSQDIAVAESNLQSAEDKLKESEPKVLEIVGSTDKAEVEAYISNLDKEIEEGLEQLNSITEE